MSATATDPWAYLIDLAGAENLGGLDLVHDTAVMLAENGRLPQRLVAVIERELLVIERERQMGAVFGLEAKTNG